MGTHLHPSSRSAQPSLAQSANVQPWIKPAADASAQQPLALCVDDNPLICRQLGKVLVGAGYRYRSCQDSMEALCVALEERPNLIFLDLMMPGMGGYELCSRLRRVSTLQNTPIVILTNSERMVDRVRGKMAGADEYLTKPTTATQVLSTVERLACFDPQVRC